ncbi:glycosyltransferase family 25 protein [Umboniibacter marinipuniceus]|uniref:Glycosyl transferase family 25 n=1 Tax=Umboniibacter marinipuniceus TaxID=569599 RepID=A0A3M0A6E3_9GAMM|nr:glycosyltransferase family 25 protein [Umboniibacter marinipuniceus]RMA80157.1 glycosyl transferase family 25 [Umboniibacter marinipuniceus]
MKITVINLPSAVDRRQFQLKQAQSLGLALSFKDAVNREQVPKAVAEALSVQWERKMSPTEVACYLSHFQLWEQISATSEPMLILEDDALLSAQLPTFLQEVAQLVDIDHISLEVRARKKLIGDKVIYTIANTELRRLYLDRTGAAAYILWPSGARKLLQLHRLSGAALADAQICRAHQLNSFQTEPPLSIQLDCCEHYGIEPPIETQSTILNTRREVEDDRGKWRYKIRRILSQLRMARRQLLYSVVATRRQLTPRVKDFNE